MPGPNDTTNLPDGTDPDLEGNDLSGNTSNNGTPAADPPELLLEATRKGWVPKEEFTGDPKRWVDAATFLDRGQKFNANLQREVQALKAKLEAFEGTKQQFIKFHEETLAAKQRDLDAAITALRVQKSEATASHEHEQAVALEDRIELLKDQRKVLTDEANAIKQPKTTEPVDKSEAALARSKQNAAVQEWVEDGNDWFAKDKVLRDHAVEVTEEMLKDGETARGRALLDLVAARVKADFPRRFASKATVPEGSAVESGNTRTAAKGKAGHSEADLPPADKAIMKDLIAGGYTTKEKFLESYFSR